MPQLDTDEEDPFADLRPPREHYDVTHLHTLYRDIIGKDRLFIPAMDDENLKQFATRYTKPQIDEAFAKATKARTITSTVTEAMHQALDPFKSQRACCNSGGGL